LAVVNETTSSHISPNAVAAGVALARRRVSRNTSPTRFPFHDDRPGPRTEDSPRSRRCVNHSQQAEHMPLYF
jgi:hypothetical protein